MYKYTTFNYPLYRRKYFKRLYSETFTSIKKPRFIIEKNELMYYNFHNYLFNFELTGMIDPDVALLKFSTSD